VNVRGPEEQEKNNGKKYASQSSGLGSSPKSITVNKDAIPLKWEIHVRPIKKIHKKWFSS
jgi:hypothetical protein